MLKPSWLVFLIVIPISLVLLSGCKVKDAKETTMVCYSYDISSDEDYLTLFSRVFDDRSVYVKFREDKTFGNMILAMGQAYEASKPDYTASTKVKETYSGYDIETQYTKTPKYDYTAYIGRNEDLGEIRVDLVDDLLLYSAQVSQMYKERPKGWREDISNTMMQLKNRRQKSSKGTTLFHIYTNFRLTEGADKFIQDNIFLDDMYGNRYKATNVIINSESDAFVYYPYKISKKDDYVSMFAYNILGQGDHSFTWNFVNHKE